MSPFHFVTDPMFAQRPIVETESTGQVRKVRTPPTLCARKLRMPCLPFRSAQEFEGRGMAWQHRRKTYSAVIANHTPCRLYGRVRQTFLPC
jgi:hypothetical protein